MPSFPPRKRRERHDIIIDILESAKNGIRKTAIMEKARLSFSQLEEYLDALQRAGFLAEDSKIWKTTGEGLQVIEACRICQTLAKKAVASATQRKLNNLKK